MLIFLLKRMVINNNNNCNSDHSKYGCQYPNHANFKVLVTVFSFLFDT